VEHVAQRQDARPRLEILEAIIAAVDRRVEVVEVVAETDNADAARGRIAELLAVTEVGVLAVLDLQLRRSSQREVQRLRDERDELRALSEE
jgi:DNA gyrase subunit A